jgi:hypothetical protein
MQTETKPSIMEGCLLKRMIAISDWDFAVPAEPVQLVQVCSVLAVMSSAPACCPREQILAQRNGARQKPIR